LHGVDADGEAVQDCGRLVAHTVRESEDLGCGDERVLSEAAAQVAQLRAEVVVSGGAEAAGVAAREGLHARAVAGADVGHPIAHGGHRAAKLVPAEEALPSRRSLTRGATMKVEIASADARRLHTEEHFSGTRSRSLHFLDADLSRSIGYGNFHGWLLVVRL
jgi:hypothetical protein